MAQLYSEVLGGLSDEAGASYEEIRSRAMSPKKGPNGCVLGHFRPILASSNGPKKAGQECRSNNQIRQRKLFWALHFDWLRGVRISSFGAKIAFRSAFRGYFAYISKRLRKIMCIFFGCIAHSTTVLCACSYPSKVCLITFHYMKQIQC